jgi:hypothetical protein
MSATHSTVLELVTRVNALGHKLYMDSYFSSPALFDDLFGRKINCCGTVRNDRRGMPKDISSRAIKTKKGKVITRSEEIRVLFAGRINVMAMFSQICILLQWKAISATNLAMQSNLV